MAKIYESVTELIGGTPILNAKNFAKQAGANATLLAKLEYFNPAGSVKDRIAKAMIDEAEKSKRRFCYYRANQRKYRNRFGIYSSSERLPYYFDNA